MAKKGKEKNTKNKAKHSKLLARKKNKQKAQKEERVARLKEITKKGRKETENVIARS